MSMAVEEPFLATAGAGAAAGAALAPLARRRLCRRSTLSFSAAMAATRIPMTIARTTAGRQKRSRSRVSDRSRHGRRATAAAAAAHRTGRLQAAEGPRGRRTKMPLLARKALARGRRPRGPLRAAFDPASRLLNVVVSRRRRQWRGASFNKVLEVSEEAPTSAVAAAAAARTAHSPRSCPLRLSAIST